MLKSTGNDGEEPTKCSNTMTIMIEIARSAYLEDVLFASAKSKERQEILSFIELAQRMPTEELANHVN